MTHYTSALSRLFLIACLLVVFSIVITAQEPTKNPIFTPLSGTQSDNTPNEVLPTPNVEEEDIQPNTGTTDHLESPVPIEKKEHHVLLRPIEITADTVHWADRTYAYGSTQWDTRQVHLGVDFVNKRFTPIYAAADGTVIFAGNDSEFPLGPYEDYYGNVVIIAHDMDTLDGEQVFTLYGHMDRVEVAEGDEVEKGERIGRVGSSGIAAEPHLHFEVRVGEPFDYRFTRNPELWLQYYVDHGMIAGYVHDGEGQPIYNQRIVVRSETVNREVFTYAGDRVNRDPVWQEDFTVGDLPADDYEIVILNERGAVAYRNTVTVKPYKTTFVDIVIEPIN